MIRLKSFDGASYQSLREEYLKRLIASRAIAFDPLDVLLKDEQTKAMPSKASGRTTRTTEDTYSALDKSPALVPLKKYLFNEDETINKMNLRLLLAGPEPEEMPESFGGNGRYSTMREVFEEIIGEIGAIRKPKFKKRQEQADPEAQAHLEEWYICRNIFSYHRLNCISKSAPEKTAYWLLQQLHVDVCPFCNRIYTSTVFRGSVRASFDHFYPQSVYPYLAVSLFNLIPICDVCNKNKSDNAEVVLNILIPDVQNNVDPDEASIHKSPPAQPGDLYNEAKHDEKETSETISIIYPYDESFDESTETSFPAHVSFRVIPQGERPWDVLRGKSEQFIIQFHPINEIGSILEDSHCSMLAPANLNVRFPFQTPKYWMRVRNSITLLRLEDLYDTHKNEVMHILRNRYQYNRTAIEFTLQPLLSKDLLHKSNDILLLEARNMLYFANLNPDDWGLAPLNKLKADILKQMDRLEMLCFSENDLLGEDEEHG